MWFQTQPAVELGVARDDILAHGFRCGGERVPLNRGCPTSGMAGHDTGPVQGEGE
jgi:hypothetical protein